MKFFLFALFAISMTFMSAQALEEDLDSENEVLRYGRCRTSWCPNVWEPVCASNNRCIKQFNSACMVRLQNCRSAPNDRYNIIPSHYCVGAKYCN